MIGMISWAQLWELVALASLLFISNQISAPLGGLMHYLVARTTHISRIGWLFRRLLQRPFYLNAITKPTAWLISSSGLLIGLALHNFFWGTLNTNIEYWILLIFATIAILEILNSILTFDAEHYYIDQIMESIDTIPFLKNDLRTIMRYADEEDFIRLARSAFVDQAIPQFFRLLISIGIAYYALASLNLIETTAVSPPTIWEAIILAFSLIDITGEIAIPFIGTVWEIIRLISAFVSFFWLVMFITLASGSVDEAATRARERARERSENRMREMVESMIAQRERQTAPAATGIPAPMIKIIEALVDPVEAVDSGNETITLYNPADQAIVVEGWKLEDSDCNRLIIESATIGAREKHFVMIPRETIYLRNNRGHITLLDQHDNIIDRVEYDRSAIDSAGVIRWFEH